MKKVITHKVQLLLFLLLFIGGILRFYNLNWGAPYYFHPDERNIAASVSQLQFPSNMNPHFFAYGSLPIYVIFFTTLPLSLLSSCHTAPTLCHVRFEDALVIGRTYSALFSLALILLTYSIGKNLLSRKAGLLAAILTTFSTGLIQFAHFATFELWTTFFATLLFLVCLHTLSNPDKKNILRLALLTGILLSIKATNLLLLPIPFTAIGIGLLINRKTLHKKQLIFRFLLNSLFLLIATAVIFLLTNPFTFLDTNSFQGSMEYESGVALGTLPVFYTGEFYHTLPILYQALKVFPFLLSPFLSVLSAASFVFIVLICVKKKSAKLFLLLLMTALLFFPQTFFFVKWVRYMVPTLPFFILLSALFLTYLIENKRINKLIPQTMITLSVVTTILFGFSYFITAFVEQDTRVAAAKEGAQIMQSDAPILTEMYDMGIVSFNERFRHITLFNFYDLDNPSPESNDQTLAENLRAHDYLILPSQRILATRLAHPKEFPKGYSFYHSLLTDKQQYKKIYETPCSIFCEITYLGDQVFRFEGTANTFERPPVQIYKIVHDE